MLQRLSQNNIYDVLSDPEVSYVTDIESRDKYHLFISFHSVTVFGLLLQFTLNRFKCILLDLLYETTNKSYTLENYLLFLVLHQKLASFSLPNSKQLLFLYSTAKGSLCMFYGNV